MKSFKDDIYKVALNTFELTCYMFALEEWELEDAGDLQKPDGQIRSVVEFDGAAKGGMVISPSDDLLNAIAANMLGVEDVSDEEKKGALCEIANIICGNTVPLFANNDNICFIRPPRILEPKEDIHASYEGKQCENIQVLLDEGIADITLFYSQEEQHD